MNNNHQEFLDLLKRVRENKDLDQIGELFVSIISMYGLTADETCAIAYYLLDTTLKAKHNKQLLREQFSIDVDTLSLDGKLVVMKAMLATYNDKVHSNGTA